MDLDKKNEFMNVLSRSGGKSSIEDLWYPKKFINEVPAYISEIYKTEISEKEKYTIKNEMNQFRYDVIYYVDKNTSNSIAKTKLEFGRNYVN